MTPLEKFAIKEKFFGREVRDILGTSDNFRCERHEPYDSWLLRLTKAGLRPYVGDRRCRSRCRTTAGRSSGRGWSASATAGVPLIAVFAYRSPEGP
jgi:hypothetical protein